MSTIWVNQPKRLYIIETDKKTYKVECEYLNYKNVIKELKQAGHNKININCLGYAIHNNY